MCDPVVCVINFILEVGIRWKNRSRRAPDVHWLGGWQSAGVHCQ